MSTFDTPEFERWATAAREELEAARHNSDGSLYNIAVLHAEQAAQCALKALLHGVGARTIGSVELAWDALQQAAAGEEDSSGDAG